MNAKETERTGGGAGAVTGSVRVDYRDPLTGRTKERHEDRNHIFEDSFKCSFWSNVLSQTARDQFFVTDDATPPSDDFPYLRGNIIGMGRPATAAGARQGAFAAADSMPCGEDIGGGMGRRFRHVYDFTPAQLLEGVGSFGFTSQYSPYMHLAGNPTDNNFLRPLRERRANVWPTSPQSPVNVANVFRRDAAYRLHQSATNDNAAVTVMRQNLLIPSGDGAYSNTDVSGHFAGLGNGQERAVGLAFDTRMAYLLMLSPAAAQRRLMEFEDDTFRNLLATYMLPATAHVTGLRLFAVHGNAIFMYHPLTGQMGYVEDFAAPTDWRYAEALPCPYNAALNPGQRSVTVERGMLWSFGHGRQPIFDARTKKQVANTFAVPTGQGTIGTCTDPSLGHRMFLHAVSPGLYGNAACDFITTQALCCYAMPPGAPPRPDGTGVRISYQLDVTF